MYKFRPKLTDIERKELENLSSLDFSDYSEADIREEYIVPILKMLGYSKEIDYSIDREESFSLHPLFLNVGSSRIRLDYIFSVRKQYFWLIDAKSGVGGSKEQPKPISTDDVGQAFFYSLHPSVNCKYFILCNGWYTNLYDRDTLSEAATPILSILSSDLPNRFLELDKFIGSTQIISHLKRSTIGYLEKILSSEVNLERLDEFSDQVKSTCYKVRPVVLENFRKAAKLAEEKITDEFKEYLLTEQPFRFAETLFLSANNFSSMETISKTLLDRLDSEDPKYSTTFLFFHKILLQEIFPINDTYYGGVLHLLLTFADRDPDKVAYYENSVPISRFQVLQNWIDLVLFHLSSRIELRFIWAMQALMYKINKRVILLAKTARDMISKQSEIQWFIQPEEEIAGASISHAKYLIELIEASVQRGTGILIQKFYDRSNRKFKAELAKQYYFEFKKQVDELCEKTEDKYNSIKNELGGDWSELLFYDNINDNWDRLGSITCAVLGRFPDIVKTLSQKHISRIKLIHEIGCSNHSENLIKILGIQATKKSRSSLENIKNYYDPFKDQYEFTLQ